MASPGSRLAVWPIHIESRSRVAPQHCPLPQSDAQYLITNGPTYQDFLVDKICTLSVHVTDTLTANEEDLNRHTPDTQLRARA